MVPWGLNEMSVTYFEAPFMGLASVSNAGKKNEGYVSRCNGRGGGSPRPCRETAYMALGWCNCTERPL